MFKRKEVFMSYKKPNYVRYYGRNYVNMAGSGKIEEVKLKDGNIIAVPPNSNEFYYELGERREAELKIDRPMIFSCSVCTTNSDIALVNYAYMFDEPETIIFGRNVIIILSNEPSIGDNKLEHGENFVSYNDVKFVNVTKSSIYLKDKNDCTIMVPPSGFVVDATVKDVSNFNVGGRIVLKREKRISNWLRDIEGEEESLVILGDKAAAIAYRDLIYYCDSSKSS